MNISHSYIFVHHAGYFCVMFLYQMLGVPHFIRFFFVYDKISGVPYCMIHIYVLLQTIVENTNVYGWLHILQKSSYSTTQGAWKEMTGEEFQHFLALVIYMGILKLPRLTRYWDTKTLYHGNWARRFMSRDY